MTKAKQNSLEYNTKNITDKTLQDALNEVNTEDTAANTLQRVLLVKKGKKEYYRQKVTIPELRKTIAKTKPNTHISDTMTRVIKRGEEAPVVKKAREIREANNKIYKKALEQHGEPRILTDQPAPAPKPQKKKHLQLVWH